MPVGGAESRAHWGGRIARATLQLNPLKVRVHYPDPVIHLTVSNSISRLGPGAVCPAVPVREACRRPRGPDGERRSVDTSGQAIPYWSPGAAENTNRCLERLLQLLRHAEMLLEMGKSSRCPALPMEYL